MKCDWCGMYYPDGMWDCYYYLNLYGTDLHIICSDCYEHLKKVIYEADLPSIIQNDSIDSNRKQAKK